MTRYCLDSWAVLRWLEGERPASERVDEVLGSRPVMSWINGAEVYHVTARAAGSGIADDIVGDLRSMLDLDAASIDRIMQAERIKADHAMALGDAFAVATAIAHDAVLLTGDPEIIGSSGAWRVEDLRASTTVKREGSDDA